MSVVRKKMPTDINNTNKYLNNLFIAANVGKTTLFFKNKINGQNQEHKTDQVVHPKGLSLEYDKREQHKNGKGYNFLYHF